MLDGIHNMGEEPIVLLGARVLKPAFVLIAWAIAGYVLIDIQ